MEVTVHIDRQFDWGGLGIYIIGKDEGGRRFVVKPLDMTFESLQEVTPGGVVEPSIRMNEWQAKSFLDSLAGELVRLGYAPDAIKAKVGELESTKYHLEDMRKLVFKG